MMAIKRIFAPRLRRIFLKWQITEFWSQIQRMTEINTIAVPNIAKYINKGEEKFTTR
jgi:hypothetical protein